MLYTFWSDSPLNVTSYSSTVRLCKIIWICSQLQKKMFFQQVNIHIRVHVHAYVYKVSVCDHRNGWFSETVTRHARVAYQPPLAMHSTTQQHIYPDHSWELLHSFRCLLTFLHLEKHRHELTSTITIFIDTYPNFHFWINRFIDHCRLDSLSTSSFLSLLFSSLLCRKKWLRKTPLHFYSYSKYRTIQNKWALNQNAINSFTTTRNWASEFWFLLHFLWSNVS